MNDEITAKQSAAADRIANILVHIANEHSVRVLYPCETGSRAWDFASQDNDFDVRFIFARPVEEYLALNRMLPVRVAQLPAREVATRRNKHACGGRARRPRGWHTPLGRRLSLMTTKPQPQWGGACHSAH